ncbi:acylglycerone-phosphate reductase-like protein [Podospora didyma]|uniref:Acylglycerone-phosphate reductase-like protein n=1 Tax=Podospora didyma TaxID=330526 RepID=A0AAE0U401_9PEZI|nr:acylglycerone-phosphate reductase-like protein [Podospora didyma]
MGPLPGQKTVLITGCTPAGIGHALALEFHARGIYVIATARRTSVLTDLAALGMSTLALDVTKPESIKTCHEEVAKITGGTLDFLVNNAGRTYTLPATDLNMDEARDTFEINVFGLMSMCAAFADQIIAAKGLIINMASLSAITPYAFGSVYCASKAAVMAYSRTLRIELRPFGARVMIAMAGNVRSLINSKPHADLPADSIYQPIEAEFQRRLTFSQTHKTIKTEDFAQKLVGNALKPEWPVMLRRWFGRPDWFYAGGSANRVWFATSLGEWVLDSIMYRMFKLDRFEKVLREQERQQRKLK